jgi:hypothetical protein
VTAWSQLNSGFTARGTAIWGASDRIGGTSVTDVYFTLQNVSTVYHWDGSAFKPVMGLPSLYAKTAVYATPAQVFMTTSVGEVIAGSGTTWQTLGQYYNGQFDQIAGFAAGQVWFGGLGGAVASYKP